MHSMNGSASGGHPCLVLIFKMNASDISHLSRIFFIPFWQIAFIRIRMFLLISSQLRLFTMDLYQISQMIFLLSLS